MLPGDSGVLGVLLGQLLLRQSALDGRVRGGGYGR